MRRQEAGDSSTRDTRLPREFDLGNFYAQLAIARVLPIREELLA
ncbi:MAG TPA: hypothetical protein VFB12_19480 [Ktedonobacteraceae bacterium]|nr:hypothetical protein [Ktedonobacteraceae bacterium]